MRRRVLQKECNVSNLADLGVCGTFQEQEQRGLASVSHGAPEHPGGHMYVIVRRCADGRCGGRVAPLLDGNFAPWPHKKSGGRHIDQAESLQLLELRKIDMALLQQGKGRH